MNKYLLILFNLFKDLFNKKPTQESNVDLDLLCSQVFPKGNVNNIKEYYVMLVKELHKQGLFSREMLIYCLATIAVETNTYEPLRERPSKFSSRRTSPPYDYSAYDGRMGNGIGADGGARWHGRGFIQLTGKANYRAADENLSYEGALLANPDLALQPSIATQILVNYMRSNINNIIPALNNRDFTKLRKIVNGGTMGLSKFIESFVKLENIIK